MGRANGQHVIDLTIGGGITMELGAVPRGSTPLDESLALWQYQIGLTKYLVGIWIAIRALCFIAGNDVGNGLKVYWFEWRSVLRFK